MEPHQLLYPEHGPRKKNVAPRYTVPKAMDDFIVNNEKKKHSSYGMKSFIPQDECFLHFIINNEIIHGFWDSVLHAYYRHTVIFHSFNPVGLKISALC
jgi:hypothetical protein